MSPENNTEEPSYLNYKGKYKGIFSWIFSTDHKRIGLLYLFSILTFFIIGATLGLLMKFELIAPGTTIMDAQSYNAFFTLHGIIMIFAVVIPGLPAVFGNFLLPIMIGAKDVAFPKINLLSWYLYVTGVTLVIVISICRTGTPRHRMDILCTLQLQNYQYHASGSIWCIRPWIFVNSYRSELSGNYSQDARPGYDLAKNAIIPMVALCNRMGTAPGDPYYRDYFAHDCCRKNITYRFFRSDPWRRPYSLSAFILDLQSSGSLYYDIACHGSYFRNNINIFS